MNKKWFWFLIVLGAVVFVGGPLFVQYNHWPQGTKGHGDWLSFWGSYLGVVPSGLIAYLVARYQIEKDNQAKDHDKILHSLPYFDINEFNFMYTSDKVSPCVILTISTNEPDMPLRYFKVRAFLKSSNELRNIIQTKVKNFGHVFPKKIEPFYLEEEKVAKPTDFNIIDRLDISCNLVNNHRVFYTYGDGITGHVYINNDNGKLTMYDGNKNDIDGIRKRIKNFDNIIDSNQ